MRWSAWLATTRNLAPWDVERLVAHFDYEPQGDGWAMATEHGGRLDITLEGFSFTSRMPRHWTTEMEQALSGRLRRAKLVSFVPMRYHDDGPEGELSEATAAGWMRCLELARLAEEDARWPCILCQPNPDLTELRILHPAET